MRDTKQIPLSKKDLDSEFSITGLKWQDFKWGIRTLKIGDKCLGEIYNFMFYKRK